MTSKNMFAGLIIACCALIFSSTLGAAGTAGPYVWRNAMLRVTPSGMGAAYVQIDNPTTKPDKLVSAKAHWAERIELHHVVTTPDNVKKMKKIDSITLVSEGSLALAPGGYHLMVFGISDKISATGTEEITLTFQEAGDLVIPFKIQSLGQADASHAKHVSQTESLAVDEHAHHH